jgi:hypothetical protein
MLVEGILVLVVLLTVLGRVEERPDEGETPPEIVREVGDGRSSVDEMEAPNDR